MTQNTPLYHSRFSPSGSGRWMKCPASVPFVESLNLPHRDSEYALEGTACHELVAECLIDGHMDAHMFLDREFIKGFPVNHEMANAANVYLDYVRSHIDLTSVMEVEKRIEMNDLHPRTGGTSDVAIYSPKELHVFDLKYGRGVPVEVEENYQLMLYCAGRLRELAQLGVIIPEQLERIVLHIVQPRCPHPDGPCRSWTVSLERLRQHWREAKAAIKNSISDNPTFNPGESQCKWCDGAPVCKALASKNIENAKLEFEAFKEKRLDVIAANLMSKEDVANVMRHSDTLLNWVNSVVAYAQNELERGRPFPGYKLVRGRSIRGWATGSEEKIKAFVKSLGFDEKDAYSTPKIKSPNQIEQLVGKKNADGIADCIVKPLGKITIAPESDKREAVNPMVDAASEFSAFASEESSDE